MKPSLQNARTDNAMREVVDQLRQAREYAISNRRYVQITFPIVAGQSEVRMTQVNTLRSGGGADEPHLKQCGYSASVAVYRFSTKGRDTPDAYGNSASIVFERSQRRPAGRNVFPERRRTRSNGATSQPINGTVFIGVPGDATTARADDRDGRYRASARLERRWGNMVSVLKETASNADAKKRQTAEGFTLLETMIALVGVGVGILASRRHARGLTCLHAGVGIRFHRAAEGRRSCRSHFHRQIHQYDTFSQISNSTHGKPRLGYFWWGPGACGAGR